MSCVQLRPLSLTVELAVMRLPILAFCDGDLEVFESIEDAESYIEPIDVRAGSWIAFDSDAIPLPIRVEKRKTVVPFLNVEGTKIVERDSSSSSPEVLQELLRKNLREFPHCRLYGITEKWLAHASLDELVLKVMTLYGKA